MTERVTKIELSDVVLALEKQHSILNGFQDRFDARHGRHAAHVFHPLQSALAELIANLKTLEEVNDISIYLDDKGNVVMSETDRLLTKLDSYDVDHIRFLKGE